MKKFIKNHLAVILSFAIVLTTILPVLNGVFTKADSAEITAAVETLKTEWVKLGQSVDSTLRVNRYFVGGASTGDKGTPVANYTDTLPEGVRLGSHYGEITLTDAAINISGRSQQLFLEGNATNTVGDLEDIVFWVKPTFAGQGDISFNVTVTFSAQNTYANPVVIPASKDGQWIKVSLDEVQGGDWKAAFASATAAKPMRLELTFTGNNGDKVLVTSAQEIIARTLPAGSENWSGEEWLDAAKAVTGIVNDATAFNGAILTLEAALANQSPEAIALNELKNAWKKLGTAQNSNLRVNRYFVGGTSTGDKGTPVANYTDTLPEGVRLGSHYGEITLSGAGNFNNNDQVLLFEGGSVNTTGNIKDIVFWVKPTFAGGESITVKAGLVYTSRTVLPGSINIPASKNGEWVKISLDELGGGDWTTLLASALTRNVVRLDVHFAGNNGDKLLVGSVLEVTADTTALPEGSEDWDYATWVTEAKALDVSTAVNAKEFKTAVTNLESVLGDEVEKAIAVNGLKEAWKNLGSSVNSTLRVNRYFVGGASTGDKGTPVANYTDTLPEGVRLGSHYGEITLSGIGNFNNNDQVLLFEGGSVNTTGNIEDIVFWVKPTFAGEESITVKAGLVYSSRTVLPGSINIPASKNGEWVKISLDELGGGDWTTLLASALTRNVARLDVHFAGNNGDTVLVGSALEVLGERALPEGSESWTADQWIIAASELDLSGALNVDAFNDAVKNLGQFVTASADELKAIGNLKTAWENLGEATVSTLVPNRYFVGGVSSVAQKSAASYKGELPNGVTLGSLYGEITLTDAPIDVANRSQQLFLEANSTNNVGDIDDIVFWVKPTFAGQGDITFNVTVTFSAQNTYTNSVVIPASKSGEWMEISLDDVAGGDWKSGFASAASRGVARLELTFTGNNGDTVLVGSALEVTGKRTLPTGTDNWTADEWIEAAEALDLTGSVNIAEFKAAVDELYAFVSVSKEEKVAIKNLKSAWSKMGKINTSTLVTNRAYVDGELKAVGQSSLLFTEELPDGVSIGNKFAEYNVNGEGSFDTNTQVLFIEGNSTNVTGDMEDIFFWVRPTFVGTKDMSIKIAVTYSQRNTYANPVIIPASKSGEWVRVSLDDVAGGDWKATLSTAAARPVMRLELCISGNAGDILTVGSAFEVTSAASEIPADTENWNVADWLYATDHINPASYVGSEDFVAARDYAEQVRDELLIASSSTVTEYDTFADAEADLGAITDSNILLETVPAISVFDGTTAAEAQSDNIANITDGDANTVATVGGLGSNSESFVDFAFDMQGLATVREMALVNDLANPATKYYIYAGDSRSELFLAKNLVAAHTLSGEKAVQRFDFTGKHIPEGKFIGLRVYTEATYVNVPELYAYGEVMIYSVETGNFDNVRVAGIGKNLLNGIEPKFKTSASQKYPWTMFKAQFSATSKIESLTDGDVGTGVGYYQQIPENADDKVTLHIYYDLGDTYTIEQLLLQHINLANYQTGEYEIYASADLASLFSSKNKIITYNNRVNGPNGTSVTQLFTLKKQINARYISYCVKFPVSNFELLSQGTNQGLGIRLMELGAYGPRYEKPYALVNLATRTALDVTRIDANGEATKLNDTEYDGTEHKFTYDGKNDTYANVNMEDGETLEFFYDLAADQIINKLEFKTNAGTIKRMKVYASEKLEGMYKSSSLVFTYDSAVEDMGSDIFADFTESPRTMRYVRFVIEEIEGDVLEPVEIGIIGGNDQEFFYNNLAEGKSDGSMFFTANKNGTNVISEHINKWKFGHTTWDVMYHSGNALDNDPDTVFDFYGGINGEESLNMLIDMGTLNSIDNVQIWGGSSEKYWPDEVNFYFGTNDLDIFSENSVPAKKWTTKAADGIFNFDFVPQIAQYVRVEIVRSDDTIYSYERYGNKIATVLAEIQVNGLEARGRVVDGVVASFTDEETGITANINALRDNDVYTTVQDILVVKRGATADETAAVKEGNLMDILSDVYEVYLLDLNGNIVTDFDGRTVTYRIPQNLIGQTEDVYVLHGGWGGFNMVEFETVGGYYCATFDDATFSHFALGAFAEGGEGEPEDETPTDTDNNVSGGTTDNDTDNNGSVSGGAAGDSTEGNTGDTDDKDSSGTTEGAVGDNWTDNSDDNSYGDDSSDNDSLDNDDSSDNDSDDKDSEDDDDDDEEETKKKKRKKIRVVRKPKSDDFNYLWIIIAAVAVVVIAAGVTLFIILKKKKNKEQIEE